MAENMVENAHAVVVFGSANMDLSVSCERMPRAGETVNGSGFMTNAGGKGANQAVAASRMGARTYMVGAVGDDTFGAELIDGLVKAGVDCAHMERRQDATTGTATIIRSEGDNRIVLSPGANHSLQPADVERALDAIAEELTLQSGAPAAADAIAPASESVLLVQGECDMATTAAAIVHAHRLGFFTVFNPAPACDLPLEVWSEVDLVCPNETECDVLTGILPASEESCQQALRALVAKGAGTAVITLGGEGSVTIDDEGYVLRMPSLSHSVVDTTAAGDTYIGAFVAARVSGMPVFECMAAGARAAAVTVSRLGAQQSIPTLEELVAWMSEEG